VTTGAEAQDPADRSDGVAGDGSNRRSTTLPVLGARISRLTWDEAVATISLWAERAEARVVCICSAHSVVTATRDPAFGRVVASADMATPDGAPVAWVMRRLGAREQLRLDGSGVMWRSCARAAEAGHPIYLYGSAPRTLAALERRLQQAFPDLLIAGAESPPFRSLTSAEDADVVRRVEASGARLVFVSLGCPAQGDRVEQLADHRVRRLALALRVVV